MTEITSFTIDNVPDNETAGQLRTGLDYGTITINGREVTVNTEYLNAETTRMRFQQLRDSVKAGCLRFLDTVVAIDAILEEKLYLLPHDETGEPIYKTEDEFLSGYVGFGRSALSKMRAARDAALWLDEVRSDRPELGQCLSPSLHAYYEFSMIPEEQRLDVLEELHHRNPISKVTGPMLREWRETPAIAETSHQDASNVTDEADTGDVQESAEQTPSEEVLADTMTASDMTEATMHATEDADAEETPVASVQQEVTPVVELIETATSSADTAAQSTMCGAQITLQLPGDDKPAVFGAAWLTDLIVAALRSEEFQKAICAGIVAYRNDTTSQTKEPPSACALFDAYKAFGNGVYDMLEQEPGNPFKQSLTPSSIELQ